MSARPRLSVRARRMVATVSATTLATVLLPAASASATPVCTDLYKNGPPREQCGGRIFPEAANSQAYVQFTPDPVTGFAEYRHGLEYLEMLYPRWVEITTFRELFGTDEAVTSGFDGFRSFQDGDSGDGFDVLVIKITDREVDDAEKLPIFFSLSVHGNERGGLEGGLRTAEDLAMAAENGGAIVDGYDNYTSNTGREPEFRSYEVSDVLAQEVLYLVDFNIDGWVRGDTFAPNGARSIYGRQNGMGTDLNRQMPTVGRIDVTRNPLEETETKYGVELMERLAASSDKGLMAFGGDIHGELTSRAYMDIMYPAGQFDSVDHRRLMAIAERTKSVIDETLFEGIVDQMEDAQGGNEGQGIEDQDPFDTGLIDNTIPTTPAHWATVWDTLGYTDTGFIGDYMATDLAVTGMDYEIAFNHTVPERVWNVYLQENHINATRGIITTTMAYALTQELEFSDETVVIDPVGRAGYVVNPHRVTDTDENGPGRLPGPFADGIGANGKPVEQVPYSVSNQQWFLDTNRLMPEPFVGLKAADIAADPAYLDLVDTVVLSDLVVPDDVDGRDFDLDDYFANLRAWVERGGNLVLTDRAMHLLPALDVVQGEASVHEVPVYLGYANFTNFDDPMLDGLRANARQLVDSTLVGYGIDNGEVKAEMTVVDRALFEAAGGTVVGTTGNTSGSSDDGSKVSVGHVDVGDGRIQFIGSALPTPVEFNDHRFGLRDYAMTYTALYIMENVIVHDAPGLGEAPLPADRVVMGEVAAAPVADDAAPTPAPDPVPSAPLPATGGGLVLVSLLSLAGARVLRRG